MIRAFLTGDEEMVARLTSMNGRVHAAVLKAVKKLVVLVRNQVITHHLHGPRPGKLDVVTGRLQNSITTNVQDLANSVMGIVGTNVSYARLHEYGGTITRTTVREIVLRTEKGEAVESIFEESTHEAKYPERSFLRSSLKEMGTTIQFELEQAIRGVVKH
jgi:phage gpG-like protein